MNLGQTNFWDHSKDTFGLTSTGQSKSFTGPKFENVAAQSELIRDTTFLDVFSDLHNHLRNPWCPWTVLEACVLESCAVWPAPVLEHIGVSAAP